MSEDTPVEVPGDYVFGTLHVMEVRRRDDNELAFTVAVLIPNRSWEAAADVLLKAYAEHRLQTGNWVLGGQHVVSQDLLKDYRQGGER